MPSASSLTTKVMQSSKSFIWIKNNRGPKIDPWETPAVTFAQEVWLLSTILCFLSLKKSDNMFNRSPDIPFSLSLKKSLDVKLYQRLQIYLKTLLISNLSSKEL